MSLDLNDGGPQFTGYDIHDLNERLAERANEWVPIYFPRGFVSKNRRELRLANISGDPPRNLGSCSIALKGEDAGCWWDFQDEKGGGPLDTLAHATGLFGRELFAKATEIVGGPRQKGRPPASRPNGPTKSVASEHILLATSIWETTQDPYGTPTEAYIVDVRGLGAFPSSTEDLRHCEFCTDYAAKIARPAMIARIRRADTGEPTGGIHRTYLLEDGRPAKEAMGGKHKMALGPTQIEGGVVMLASMTADGRLGVAEGIETALAMTEINRRATGELFPIWATLGDWGMASMPFPPGLNQLLIFADGGKAGVTAAERLQGRALATGIEATYYLPKSGDDFARDLELRLWEQQTEPEQEARAIAQSNGSTVGAHPAAGTTDPGDSPSVSPSVVASPPQGLLEGSNLEQAPAWSASAGPIPPQTLEAILDAAASLTRDLTPETRQNILFTLRGVALAGLDSIGERQALDAIKTKTGLPIGDLRRQLAGFRKQMGLNTSSKAAQPWLTKMATFDNLDPKPILMNIAIVLREAPEIQGMLAYNSFSCRIQLLHKPPWINGDVWEERAWTDHDELAATEWIQTVAGIHAPRGIVYDAVSLVAGERQFHPVRDYLRGLVWDGRPRLDNWLFTYAGAPDLDDDGRVSEKLIAYTRAVGAKFLISGVARVMRPGCKADCALIFEGKQGKLKSTAFRVLFDPWYLDGIRDIRSKDALIELQGIWGVEFAELDSLKHAETSRIKAFLSSNSDRFRSPYGRVATDYPRQCVFCGTVNEFTWLNDHTGGRRFWPVKCAGEIDIQRLKEDKDQLWAEAVVRYDAGEPWYLEDEAIVQIAKEEQGKRLHADALGETVEEWLLRYAIDDTSIPEILRGALELHDKSLWTRTLETRIGNYLHSMGWTSYRIRHGSERGRRRYCSPSQEESP